MIIIVVVVVVVVDDDDDDEMSVMLSGHGDSYVDLMSTLW